MAEAQSSQVLPASHHDVNEDTSHGGDVDEFPQPTEPVEEPSEGNQSDGRETHERPTRQRRAPTMLTYDTLGTPSFHQPFAQCTTNHTAGVTPVSAPALEGTVLGPPGYTWLNCAWPWAYPVSYGPFWAHPYWTNWTLILMLKWHCLTVQLVKNYKTFIKCGKITTFVPP